jgi:hypothetical protein
MQRIALLDWRSLSAGDAEIKAAATSVKFSFPIAIETLVTDVSSVATFTFTVSVFLVNLLDRDNIPRETIRQSTI